MDEQNTLLRDVIARHFPEARIGDDAIDLGFGGLQISCRVDEVGHFGDYQTAVLFFQLRGGGVGGSPVYASVSGYGKSADEAIVSGACTWACTFGPVLRAGLAGETQPDVSRFDVVHGGQRFHVFVDGLDRAFSFDGKDVEGRLAAGRERFAPTSWLTRVVLDSSRLPVLHPERPTILSVFVGDLPDRRIVEVKIDGLDWPDMDEVFAYAAPEPPGAMTMLRELAVVVPSEPAPPLARASLERTLQGLGDARIGRAAAGWHGWQHHGGQLGAPLEVEALAALEARIGVLPDDYRAFVSTVAASGAGPGYGLMTPMTDPQAELARGTFAWEHDVEPSAASRGVLALAHAGCGVMWLLVLEGARRGEVWVDAVGSDGKARRVASSFTEWYREWLAAAIRDASPWCQWDSACCATPGLISQLLAKMEQEGIAAEAVANEMARRLGPGAITLTTGGSAYFAAGTPLDPCHGCVALAARFGLAGDVFKSSDEPPPAPRGWWRKLSSRLRR
jgi:hypothetical protein